MVRKRPLGEVEQKMWRGYLDSTRQLLRLLDRQLAEDTGMSLTDYEILAMLAETPKGCVRMHEIADAMGATRGGATRAVSRLVETGWVSRQSCPDDGRGSFAKLTAAGAAKLKTADVCHAKAVRRYLFDLLDVSEVEQLADIYARVCEYLNADGTVGAISG